MAEIAGGLPSDVYPRLEAMEANGTDYFTFKGLMNTFRAGYTLVTDAIDAKLVPVADAILALQGASPVLISPNAMTKDALLTNYPASSSNVGKQAKLSDLYTAVSGKVESRFDGTNYAWVPLLDKFNAPVSATSGSVSVTSLGTPPTSRVNGASLLGSLNFVTSTTGAWVGDRKRIIVVGLLGAYSVVIKGLTGGDLPILSNQTKEIEYGSTGWFSIT